MTNLHHRTSAHNTPLAIATSSNMAPTVIIQPICTCQGCGICAAECPGKAISLGNFRDEQLLAKVDALNDRVGRPDGNRRRVR